MGRRKKSVHSIKSGVNATHIKIPKEKKAKEETISGYKSKTGIVNPDCSQNLRVLKIQSGPSKGEKVHSGCNGLKVAAHVTISGKAGVYIVPMCNVHNDSWGGYPKSGDCVRLKKCAAVKVEHNLGSGRRAGKTLTKSTNTKVQNMSQAKILRLARSRGQKTWSWKGQRMGNISDYKITRLSGRVVKK